MRVGSRPPARRRSGREPEHLHRQRHGLRDTARASSPREIERVAGVTAVAVDVENGVVTVTSDRDLDVADVRAAVEEAGYELVRA
ncbi:hypothetical protein GCM10018965_037190 [Nonomuraea roseola]